MSFFSRKRSEKDFSHCHGCGLCTAVCPAWQQSRDVSYSPHGHAKALQFGGEVSAKGVLACILCGACDPVCPENIPLLPMLSDLRAKVRGNTPLHKLAPTTRKIKSSASILLLVDDALKQHPSLCHQTWQHLNDAGIGRVELASDSMHALSHALSLALQQGEEIPVERLDAFLDGLQQTASILILGDGLLKRHLAQWWPRLETYSLGYALSRLPSLYKQLGHHDLYIIESQAYHSDFNAMVKHYDALKRRQGCQLNFDLQRFAVPTGGLAPQATAFDAPRQSQWLIKGLHFERIVVESMADGFVLKKITDKPVVPIAAL